MKKIIYPKYGANGKLLKDGSINGVPLKKIYKECGKWADEYVKKNFPHLMKEE